MTTFRFLRHAAWLAAGCWVVAMPAAAIADDVEACATTPAEAAIPFCTRAIESGRVKGRDLAGVYLNRGLRFDYKGDPDRAIADYDAAIRIEPKNAFAYFNRGAVYLHKKEFDHAIADYDETIRLAPKAWQPLRNRGAAHFGAGQYDRARADFEAVLGMDAKSAEGLYGRGVTKLKSGDAAGGNADIAAAKAIKADIAERWADDIRIRVE